MNELENVQRWTAKRLSALVLSLLKGETSAQEAAGKHGLTVAEFERWWDQYLPGVTCTESHLPHVPRKIRSQRLRRLTRVYFGNSGRGKVTRPQTLSAG